MDASQLPRWRGFNLLEFFTAQRHQQAAADGNPVPGFQESDFQLLSDWGFDFARLPMSYVCYADPADWTAFSEPALARLDEVVEWGAKYGVHVNLNLHRAPGYCVNPPAEPKLLWNDDEALGVCASHWAMFAHRYRGIPSERLSFDLLNEPPRIDPGVYERVVRHLVGAIRMVDPDRLVIADGLSWGNVPVPGLADLGIGQSTRGYAPMQISHYEASWVKSEGWPEPTWPLVLEHETWDREKLEEVRLGPWQELEAMGVGIHVGEWGAFRFTPHEVVLAWMRDSLGLWQEAGWGWALWNLRGAFGVLDSQREDVAYEDFRGHQLDREMLALLRQF